MAKRRAGPFGATEANGGAAALIDKTTELPEKDEKAIEASLQRVDAALAGCDEVAPLVLELLQPWFSR